MYAAKPEIAIRSGSNRVCGVRKNDLGDRTVGGNEPDPREERKPYVLIRTDDDAAGQASGWRGAVSFFAAGDPDYSLLRAVSSGPDGNLWITNNQGSAFGFLGGVTLTGTIERVSTSGAQGASYPLSRVNIALGDITKGVNGDLWFCEEGDSHIGRITTAGAITEFPTAARADSIAVSSDGNLWFVASIGHVARVTTSGCDAVRKGIGGRDREHRDLRRCETDCLRLERAGGEHRDERESFHLLILLRDLMRAKRGRHGRL